MRIFFAIFLTCMILFMPGKVCSWSAIYGVSETHQYILRKAYALLLDDPVFKKSEFDGLNVREKFPGIDEILKYEGVEKWNDNWSVFDGPGPDGKNMSKYSEHYYNPVIKKGNAPKSIADYSTYLAYTVFYKNHPAINQLSQEFKYINSAKNAAYGAHYIADLSVPFHVIGTMREDINKDSFENLGPDVYGDEILRYKSPMQNHATMKTEIERFFKTEDDYFAPFFYNGTWPAVSGGSSHALWEGEVTPEYHRYTLSGYSENPDWSNAEPLFEGKIFKNLGKKAQSFAERVAQRTRSGIQDFGKNNYINNLLNNSIRDVYTLWRASFSALRPTLDKIEEHEDDEIGRHYIVPVRIMNLAYDNGKGEEARNVQVRIANADCGFTGRDMEPRSFGAVQAISDPLVWRLQPDKTCTLRIEVIGTYVKTPDLQYAMAEMVKLNPLPKKEIQKFKLSIEGFDNIKIYPGRNLKGLYTTANPTPKETDVLRYSYRWIINGKEHHTSRTREQEKDIFINTTGKNILKVELLKHTMDRSNQRWKEEVIVDTSHEFEALTPACFPSLPKEMHVRVREPYRVVFSNLNCEPKDMKIKYKWFLDGKEDLENTSHYYKGRAFMAMGKHTVGLEIFADIKDLSEPKRIGAATTDITVLTGSFDTLTDGERCGFLNCMCACTGTAVEGSQWWPGAFEDCMPYYPTNKGPCVFSGFGCWRHRPSENQTKLNECLQRCQKQFMADVHYGVWGDITWRALWGDGKSMAMFGCRRPKEANKNTLAISKTDGGKVAVNPPGSYCTGNCSFTYVHGLSANLAAQADKGYTFTGWDGDCSGTGMCTVKMDRTRQATATFARQQVQQKQQTQQQQTQTQQTTGQKPTSQATTTTKPPVQKQPTTQQPTSQSTSQSTSTKPPVQQPPAEYTLSVSKSGEGSGKVTSSPAGISCPGTCSMSVKSGVSVNLSASVDGGSVFSGWGGACSGTGSCTAKMDRSKNVTATFGKQKQPEATPPSDQKTDDCPPCSQIDCSKTPSGIKNIRCALKCCKVQ